MSKKKNVNCESDLVDIEVTPEEIASQMKDPVLPATTGFFLVLVAWAANLGVTRYILHSTEKVVNFDYMLYETAFSVILTVVLIVFFNNARIQNAIEGAESVDEFPNGGPFGFLSGKPTALCSELIAVFLVLFCGINCLIFKIIGIEIWSIWIFIIYKAIYSLFLSIAVHWVSLSRFLQPDILERRLKEKNSNLKK